MQLVTLRTCIVTTLIMVTKEFLPLIIDYLYGLFYIMLLNIYVIILIYIDLLG